MPLPDLQRLQELSWSPPLSTDQSSTFCLLGKRERKGKKKVWKENWSVSGQNMSLKCRNQQFQTVTGEMAEGSLNSTCTHWGTDKSQTSVSIPLIIPIVQSSLRPLSQRHFFGYYVRWMNITMPIALQQEQYGLTDIICCSIVTTPTRRRYFRSSIF